MYRTFLVAALAALMAHTAAAPSAAGMGEAAELEAARANARAGGPVSARDVELLERWGCLSGTESAFCKRLSRHGRQYRRRPDPKSR